MEKEDSQSVGKLKAWILASRPKTLLAAFVPVITGTAVAISDGAFNLLPALDALICAVLIQVGTNFSNDLFDFLSGADSPNRVGPKRALTEGWITVKEMKIGIALTFGITFLLGLYLVYVGGWVILLIGILSILAGLAYTAGPLPLAYNGLGDIFVFIFFGIIGTVGTYYVQSLQVNTFAFLSSIPVGALVTNILIVNNYRDTDEDRLAGKKTLAVIFGKKFSRFQYLTLLILSYLVPVLFYFFFEKSIFIFLPFLSLPLAIKVAKMMFTLEGEELNKTLELTSKLSIIFSFLFAIGIVV